MNQRITKHIDLIFESAPKTKKAMELKEELIQNSNEKYEDMIAHGSSEDDAFQSVIASIGDVTELFDDLEDKNQYNMKEADKKKKALLTAIAIGLYIFAGVAFFTCVMIDEAVYSNIDISTLGIIIAAAICIIPTCMLVYAASMYPEYHKKEDNMVEEYKESKNMTNRDKAIKEAVSVIIWMLVLITYFLVSFFTGAWYITWVIFLIGACVQAISELVFSLKRD